MFKTDLHLSDKLDSSKKIDWTLDPVRLDCAFKIGSDLDVYRRPADIQVRRQNLKLVKYIFINNNNNKIIRRKLASKWNT